MVQHNTVILLASVQARVDIEIQNISLKVPIRAYRSFLWLKHQQVLLGWIEALPQLHSESLRIHAPSGAPPRPSIDVSPVRVARAECDRGRRRRGQRCAHREGTGFPPLVHRIRGP